MPVASEHGVLAVMMPAPLPFLLMQDAQYQGRVMHKLMHPMPL